MNESRRFQIHWMLWSAAGLALGLVAALALGAPLETVLGAMLVTPALTSIVGAFLGTSQWVLLRRRLSNARWWIPASAAGLGLGLTAGVVLVEQIGRAITGGQVNIRMFDVVTRAGSFALVGLVSGVCLGAAQWLVLRSSSPAARSWFWTSTLSLCAAFVTGSLAADLVFGGLTAPVGFIAFVVITGLLAGALTSRPLARLRM
ncbi:MAG TPA: hypothetical protein VF789_00965 [Thermoanaerobaculia bacterium]